MYQLALVYMLAVLHQWVLLFLFVLRLAHVFRHLGMLSLSELLADLVHVVNVAIVWLLVHSLRVIFTELLDNLFIHLVV